MPLIYQKHIVRRNLRDNPKMLFVFGDNLMRRGLGGQAAEMRGEPNAVGIPTKKAPYMHEIAFFTDKIEDQHAFFNAASKDETKLLNAHKAGVTIVWPEDGIGTGLAQLQRRSPSIWAAIENLRLKLEKG